MADKFLIHLEPSTRSQAEYISDVAEIMAIRARGAVPKALVHTYGCQQNVADGEKIKGQLEQMGFSLQIKRMKRI